MVGKEIQATIAIIISVIVLFAIYGATETQDEQAEKVRESVKDSFLTAIYLLMAAGAIGLIYIIVRIAGGSQ